MTDEEFAILQRGAVLRDKAKRAVDRRQHTDKPGSDWHLSDGTPRYCGVHSVVYVYPNDEGTKYSVHVYTYAGAEIARHEYRGLDTAFRNGCRFADIGTQSRGERA